jgi:hypothetical protein
MSTFAYNIFARTYTKYSNITPTSTVFTTSTKNFAAHECDMYTRWTRLNNLLFSCKLLFPFAYNFFSLPLPFVIVIFKVIVMFKSLLLPLLPSYYSLSPTFPFSHTLTISTTPVSHRCGDLTYLLISEWFPKWNSPCLLCVLGTYTRIHIYIYIYTYIYMYGMLCVLVSIKALTCRTTDRNSKSAWKNCCPQKQLSSALTWVDEIINQKTLSRTKAHRPRALDNPRDDEKF